VEWPPSIFRVSRDGKCALCAGSWGRKASFKPPRNQGAAGGDAKERGGNNGDITRRKHRKAPKTHTAKGGTGETILLQGGEGSEST